MTKPIPDGFHTITPHIVVADAVNAIEFYKRAFGARELCRHMTPDGKGLMHARLQIGDSLIMLAGEWPPMCVAPKNRGGSSVTLGIYCENADAVFARAVEAGCSVKMPLADQFWGDRYGLLEDPSGHLWSIATHQHDYSAEQIADAATKAFAKCE
jgi:uncharacterized glyoxalase superfamily protein PhnB